MALCDQQIIASEARRFSLQPLEGMLADVPLLVSVRLPS